MWALSSASELSKSGPYIEAEIPTVATSRQAGTFQSLLTLPSILDGVSHHRGAFYIFCLLRRASPTPSLTPCRPSGPILERQAASVWQARGEEGDTCWRSSTQGLRVWSAFIKTIKQPSAEHSSAILMAWSHLPFARDHLHLVSAAVRHQPANIVCDFGYTNNDLRSHLLEKSSCSQA